MATEIQSWLVQAGKLTPITTSLSESGRKERDDLEQWIKSNPAVLGDDIAIIGEQVQTRSGPADFLGIDSSGNTVIIELKRGMLPREALVQAIDYASDISGWELERFREVCQSYTHQAFEDFFQQKFEGIALEDLAINQAQRLLLVGFGVDETLGRMIEWLSDKYSIGINAIVLSYVKTPKGDEILSRTVIIPEEVEKQKTNMKKFIIEMSNDPGTYDEPTLERKLRAYFSSHLYSSQRIRDYLLPVLLERGQVTRDDLRRVFVLRKGAIDESKAGSFLSLISNQLGQKSKDYLRQIISYEYPKHPWEKDNFRIREEYKPLVQKILEEVKPQS
jgi:hypothetical protein